MPVRRADIVGRNDHGPPLQLLYLRVGQCVRLQQFAHRNGQHASRRSHVTYPAALANTGVVFPGKRPAIGEAVPIGCPQHQLHGEADPGELGIGNHHGIESPHQFVGVRIQVGNTGIVCPIRHHQQVLLRRSHDLHIALGSFDQLGYEDLAALRKLPAKWRVVISGDVAVRQVQLAQPGLGTHRIDEIQPDGLDTGIGEGLHRTRKMRRPERQRIILVQEQGIVVDGNYGRMLGHPTLARHLVPVVVIDVLVVLKPPEPLAAQGNQQSEHSYGKELPNLAELLTGQPMRSDHESSSF